MQNDRIRKALAMQEIREVREIMSQHWDDLIAKTGPAIAKTVQNSQYDMDGGHLLLGNASGMLLHALDLSGKSFEPTEEFTLLSTSAFILGILVANRNPTLAGGAVETFADGEPGIFLSLDTAARAICKHLVEQFGLDGEDEDEGEDENSEAQE